MPFPLQASSQLIGETLSCTSPKWLDWVKGLVLDRIIIIWALPLLGVTLCYPYPTGAGHFF